MLEFIVYWGGAFLVRQANPCLQLGQPAVDLHLIAITAGYGSVVPIAEAAVFPIFVATVAKA